jgi:hypothetical protein
MIFFLKKMVKMTGSVNLNETHLSCVEDNLSVYITDLLLRKIF